MSTKYWRVRHKGNLTGNSEWSDPTSFETDLVLDFEEIGGVPQDASYVGALWTGEAFLIKPTGTTVYRSTDGVSWDAITAPINFLSMASNGSVVSSCVVGTVAYSTDHGLTWNTTNPNISNHIIYSSGIGKFVAFSQSSSQTYLFSSDGINFSGPSRDARLGQALGDCSNASLYTSYTADEVDRTINGEDFDRLSTGVALAINRAMAGTAKGYCFVSAILGGDGRLLRSLTGVNWSQFDLADGVPVVSSYAQVGKFIVAAGRPVSGGTHVATSSDDGETWTPVDSVPHLGVSTRLSPSESVPGQGYKVAYSPSLKKVVVVGTSGTAAGRAIIADTGI